jgi:hypothetical protein
MGRTIQRFGWLGVAICSAVFALQGCTSEAPPPVTSSSSTAVTTVSASTPDETSSTPPSASSTSEPASTNPSTGTDSASVSSSAPSDPYPLPTDSTTVPAESAKEQADRAAIEAVWAKVWDLYARINAVPATDRPAQVGALMIDPIRSQLLSLASQSDQKGLTFYGKITLHPYWYRPVDGQTTAVIGDCRDTSQFGEKQVATGDKTTVGVTASNTVGKFIQTADGVWHLFDVIYVTDVPCRAAP